MGHMLVLEIPEDLYEPLAKTANETGTTPEEIAVRWLITAVRQSSDDPVEKFIGALDTTVQDWADQHDKYIGDSLTEKVGAQRTES